MSFLSGMVSETLREVTSSLYDGRYSIVSTLKEGRLYLAEKAGKRFVLKTSDSSAKGIEQLKREYELSIGLSHPGLAYVFTYEEQSPVGPCIVQENVDGETLAEWLTKNPSAKDRRCVISELLSVTAYLHQKGVIHNDLKPENILITRSGGSLKLIDLGFADDDTHAEKALGGTRSYASPELLSGNRPDARSDIYSIGLLIKDIAPGRYPFFVWRCLKDDPAKRFASAGELERAWKRRLLPMWLSLAVTAAVAIGCLLYVYIGTQREFAVLKEAESARTEALSAAKAEVDAWYDTEVPTFLDNLRQAKTQAEVNAAWSVFVERTSIINTDLPARTPDDVRPALRDYAFHRYNTTFPSLQDSLTKRMLELSR